MIGAQPGTPPATALRDPAGPRGPPTAKATAGPSGASGPPQQKPLRGPAGPRGPRRRSHSGTQRGLGPPAGEATAGPSGASGLPAGAVNTENENTDSDMDDFETDKCDQRPGVRTSAEAALDNSLHLLFDTMKRDIKESCQKHPDQAPVWEKAIVPFRKHWASGSDVARQGQLYRAGSARNSTRIPVLHPERRTACPLRGRRRTNAGRPPRDSRAEHSYGRPAGRGRRQACHSLAHSQGLNFPLGR